MTRGTQPPADDADASAAGGYSTLWRDPWSTISALSLLYWIATQAVRPTVALELSALGSSDALIGGLLAVSSGATFFLAIPMGSFADRVGSRRVARIGLFVMVLAGAGLLLLRSVLGITLALVVASIAELGVWLALQALVTHAGTGDHLRRHLAVFSFMWGLGLAAGPAVGTSLYAAWGFGSLGVLYAVLAAVGLLASMVLPEPEAERGARTPGMAGLVRSVGDIWTIAPIRAVLVSSFVVLFIYGVKGTFLPLYMERAGVSVATIGWVLTTIGVTSLLIRIVLPRITGAIGTNAVLQLSMWLPIATMIALALTPPLWLTFALGAVMGVGLGMNPPITVELMALYTHPATRGVAMGLRVTSNRLARVVQPLAFGLLSTAIGLSASFAVVGVGLGVMAGVGAGPRSLARSMAEEDEQPARGR